jgi:hypothetical protein
VRAYHQQAFSPAFGWSGTFYSELVLQPTPSKGKTMPIIAWLLGVPISVILILMLFGVF